MTFGVQLAERGLVPDRVLRLGIRRVLRERLRDERARAAGDPARALARFAEHMRTAPIALHVDRANQQHYELPPALFEHILGAHLKYSACWWDEDTRTLDEAEAAMLRVTCARAQIEDGQAILELGCGWGSLCLWIAERYPSCRVHAVSNSDLQRAYILARAAARGLHNLRVTTADVQRLEIEEPVDRVVSVEMFEHIRNWERLLGRVRGWLRPSGRVFLHVFSHRVYGYAYETDGRNDWMARHFFTGGMMPAHGLLPSLRIPFDIEDSWALNGRHYARTAEAWLKRQDARRSQLAPIFARVYGARARTWFQRWRMFFLACAELFAYGDGREWMVSHYRLEPRR